MSRLYIAYDLRAESEGTKESLMLFLVDSLSEAVEELELTYGEGMIYSYVENTNDIYLDGHLMKSEATLGDERFEIKINKSTHGRKSTAGDSDSENAGDEGTDGSESDSDK